jgi:drug/metabolite transporter (DMT)-like permease
MRLFLLTTLTMIAFAANSVLNRMALEDGTGDAIAFAAIRALSGAGMLALLIGVRRGLPKDPNWRQALWLMVYLYGFSLAYLSLGSGIGALILFGMVQITMFAGAIYAGDPLPPRRVAGVVSGFGGLVLLLWPSEAFSLPRTAAGFMALAGIGWGLYSLGGRAVKDPLGQTAMNFALGAPVALLVLVLRSPEMSGQVLVLAILSGAVTSGLGYALWYQIMPRLGATRAAVAQLTVPLIAMAGGVLFLSEPLTMQFVVSALLVLGGVMLSVAPERR